MRVRYVDTVENLARAISIIEEIQRLNRAGEWKVLLDRHLVFRSILIEIKGSTANLDDDHKAVIQDGITHSSSISNKIEVALDQNDVLTGVPRMNKILSTQVEKLKDILVEMRMETNEGEDVKISVIGEEGNEIESFLDVDIQTSWLRDLGSAASPYKMMYNTYEIARRSALGTEEAINKILSELEDDDILFKDDLPF